MTNEISEDRNTAFCVLNWDVIAEVMKMANAPPELVERWGTGDYTAKLTFPDLDGTTMFTIPVSGIIERLTVGSTVGYNFNLVSIGEAVEVVNMNAMRLT